MGWIFRNIPWNGRSVPWIFPSKATFRRKNSPEVCHIVAKKALAAAFAGGPSGQEPHNQVILIFAHFRAAERARGNNAFSVLKKQLRHASCIPLGCCAAAGLAMSVSRRVSARQPAPWGPHYSIAAGEPQANPRKSTSPQFGPKGVEHPRTRT